MLDPSSSEEESDEAGRGGRDVRWRRRLAASAAGPGSGRAAGRGGARRWQRPDPVSPSPSMLSEGRDEPERQLDEEQERRIRLQLYVFVVKCIAYPSMPSSPPIWPETAEGELLAGPAVGLRLLPP